MEIKYWDQDIETISRDRLEALQLERLKKTVSQALKTDFYGGKLPERGIKSADDLKSLDDLRNLPFTTKNDLRESYPYGMLAVDRSEVVRMHASSGTTGTPTTIYLTADDLAACTDITTRSVVATGAESGDVFQNMMTYGLFTGGIVLHYGAENLGMMVIPASSGNTERQFRMMKDFQTSIIHATPSYMLYLHSRMADFGIDPAQLNLKKAYVGAEPHSEDVRRKIERLWGIDVYNSYGLSEMNGPGLAFECVHKDAMHVWEDAYIMEIINPDTLEPLPDGEEGELVLTILHRDAMPLIRYRTRDLTRIIPGQCACGRTHRRLARMKGRTDDMLIINGVNVFPSQIEEVIMRMPEVGTNYLIVVQKAGPLDKLIVKTEITRESMTDDTRDLYNLKQRIVEHLRASITIKPVVELHEQGALPVSEGKAKRVLDEREEN
ncbi:MAG: phenylacetate--CoA ligase [Spirochaetales bacterium]|uniref:Phenylacetate-coenzyme A ligase n=1 Tax=Candidatus Thalassospirochaeta sargassi TaxID=3119039 RepID=A0AAJ1IGL8_9SPIO|nr:phenylacetate--CoA ligase [Spirochaetales bacterium]